MTAHKPEQIAESTPVHDSGIDTVRRKERGASYVSCMLPSMCSGGTFADLHDL